MSDDNEKELADNETYISYKDDLEIEVMSVSDDNSPSVYVKFTGFDDAEDAEEYAEFLAETLPLLLFETTRLQ